MASAAEDTMICLDNSYWMDRHPNNCTVQYEAIKYYCETKLKWNPRNRVGLFAMSSFPYGTRVPLTRDLEWILDCVQRLLVGCNGTVHLAEALCNASCEFVKSTPNVKRRLLVFVGSPARLQFTQTDRLGRMLKKGDIALDVVHFFKFKEYISGVHDPTSRVLYLNYHNVKNLLVALVNDVNDTDKLHSQMVDVGESSVREVLSESILRENVSYLDKKDHKKVKENVDVKSVNDIDERHWVDVGQLSKSIIRMYVKKDHRKAKENVNVKTGAGTDDA